MRLALLALALVAGCTTAPATPAAELQPPGPARTAQIPQQADDAYYTAAAASVDARIAARGVKPAKNVILFIGDGMGISTITAARIYAGQSAGVDGESYHLAMDDLPFSALSKTYSHNFQIADSAGTAVAMTSGL